MTGDEAKAKMLEIVNKYDRGLFDAGDMDRELHVLAVQVDTDEREARQEARRAEHAV